MIAAGPRAPAAPIEAGACSLQLAVMYPLM
jgi:hypothetical protein